MTRIRQIVAVTLLNLRTIPQRLGSSIVGIVGIAGVVVVLVAVLSIAEGFEARCCATRARRSARWSCEAASTSEMTSGLGGPEPTSSSRRPASSQDGRTPLASAELFVIIDLPKKSTGTRSQRAAPRRRADVVRRARSGVDRRRPDAAVRHERGHRRPRGGQAVRGVGPRRRRFESGEVTWKVVGIFESDGSVAETEIWCDARMLAGRVPPREQLPVRPGPARFAAGRSTRSRIG